MCIRDRAAITHNNLQVTIQNRQHQIRQSHLSRLKVSPVSYTHLDVYKRQDEVSDDYGKKPSYRGDKRNSRGRYSAGRYYILPSSVYSRPVSYTHLDVYKRQLLIIGICYVLPVKLKKPSLFGEVLLVGIGAVEFCILIAEDVYKRQVMLQLALQNIMENMKSLCWIKKKMVYWI